MNRCALKPSDFKDGMRICNQHEMYNFIQYINIEINRENVQLELRYDVPMKKGVAIENEMKMGCRSTTA